MYSNISRIHIEASEIAEQNARMRELIARSSEVLQAPMPNTFIGRKTQEPFLKGDISPRNDSAQPSVIASRD